MAFLVQLVLFFGALTILKNFVRALRAFYVMCLRPGKNLKKYGEWCIITGATDGIGKAIAFEIAKKGMHLFLISRTQPKLETTMNEIQKKYPNVSVRILAIDYSTFDKEAQEKVANAIQKLDVGVCINNVGISYSYPMFFEELDDERIKALIDLNINSTTWMTRIVLPGMLSRKRGAIVNMASAASRNPSPLLTVYSAAKSYIELFSQSLDAEVRSKGVRVQVQCPMFVTTKMSKIRKSSVTVPTPKQFASASVASIGYESLCSPYWSHKLLLWVISLAPPALLENYTKGMHENIRKRALRKSKAQ